MNKYNLVIKDVENVNKYLKIIRAYIKIPILDLRDKIKLYEYLISDNTSINVNDFYKICLELIKNSSTLKIVKLNEAGYYNEIKLEEIEKSIDDSRKMTSVLFDDSQFLSFDIKENLSSDSIEELFKIIKNLNELNVKILKNEEISEIKMNSLKNFFFAETYELADETFIGGVEYLAQEETMEMSDHLRKFIEILTNIWKTGLLNKIRIIIIFYIVELEEGNEFKSIFIKIKDLSKILCEEILYPTCNGFIIEVGSD